MPQCKGTHGKQRNAKETKTKWKMAKSVEEIDCK